VCFTKPYPGATSGGSSATFLKTYFADCMQAQNDGYLQLLTIIWLNTGRKIVLNTRESGVAGKPTKVRPGRNRSAQCPLIFANPCVFSYPPPAGCAEHYLRVGHLLGVLFVGLFYNYIVFDCWTCNRALATGFLLLSAGLFSKERFAGLYEVTSQRSLSLDQRQASEYLADSAGLKFGLAGNGGSDIFISGDMSSVDCHHQAKTFGRYECERNASACDLGNFCGTDKNPRKSNVGIVEVQGWLVPRVQHKTILTASEKSWLSEQLDGRASY
jgi:hypothetical protein